MVTAELAAALPAAVLVLVVAVNAIVIGIDQVRCADAARMAARAAARADSPEAVQRSGLRNAPASSRVVVVEGGLDVSVTVSAPVPGPLGWLAGRSQLSATAHAERESAGGSTGGPLPPAQVAP